MRRLTRFLFQCILLVSLAIPDLSLCADRGIRSTKGNQDLQFLYKDYYALVVGVSDYEKWPDLPNAAKDAKEVASGLREFGFEVTLLLDPDSLELMSALNRLAHQIGKEKNRALLFYFAGHGETIQLADGTELGYIVPKDCPMKTQDPMGFNRRAISMKDMEVFALMVRSRHFLMIFDSCFSGSIFNLVRGAPRDIAEKAALPVRQFITAGGAGEQVPDQSIFKMIFLEGIRGEADLNKDGYVTASELGMHLQQTVVNYSRGAQHPQYGKINNPKLDKGDFLFASPDKITTLRDSEREQKGQLAVLAEEVKKLKEEREKTQALLEQMQRVLEEKLKDSEKSRQRDALTSQQLKDIEAERKLAEAKLRDESVRREALERELEKLQGEQKKLVKAVAPVQGKNGKEKRFPKNPKNVSDGAVQRVSMRSSPRELWDEDIENMIAKYNFFNAQKNVQGEFPSEFVDNGDGTIIDRATGLMWQRQGSPEALTWPEAEKYVSQLNEERRWGYNDWRVPTLEELWTLLKPEKNKNGLYIDAVFGGEQKNAWSADWVTEGFAQTRQMYVAEFKPGRVTTKNTGIQQSAILDIRSLEKGFVRAVRTFAGAATEAPRKINKELLTVVPEDINDIEGRRVSLRDTPKELWEEDIRKMIAKYNFFEERKNFRGEFPSDFEDNGDGTITDRTTGLMWQRQGSPEALTWPEVEKYVSQLNEERLVGYTDWRVPTLEELWTLLKPEKNKNGLYNDAVFGGEQKNAWSADWIPEGFAQTRQMYVAEFKPGRVTTKNTGIQQSAILDIRSLEKGFVRAVRKVSGAVAQKSD